MRISDWSSDVCSSDLLREDFYKHLSTLDDVFVQDLFGGSQPEFRVGVRIITELAWHSSFVRTMLVRPPADELQQFSANYTIIDLPSFRADPERHGLRPEPVIAIDFINKQSLIRSAERSVGHKCDGTCKS